MSLVHAVEVPRLPVSRLEPVIGAPRYAELARAADQVRQVLAGRTIWNVNSTAAGGGSPRCCRSWSGTCRTGHPDRLAGDHRRRRVLRDHQAAAQPDPRQLVRSPARRGGGRSLPQMLAANAVELAARVRPGDVVLLHDPQTAGLAAPLAQAGARVVWRCHIGVDWEDEVTRAGWDFLRPHLAAAEAYVFRAGTTSRRGSPPGRRGSSRRRSTRSPRRTSNSRPTRCGPSW